MAQKLLAQCRQHGVKDFANPKKVKIGDIFYGTEGILAITSYDTWQSFFGPKLEKGPGGSGDGDHFANFATASGVLAILPIKRTSLESPSATDAEIESP